MMEDKCENGVGLRISRPITNKKRAQSGQRGLGRNKKITITKNRSKVSKLYNR